MAYFECPMAPLCAKKYDSREKVENHLELFHRMPIAFQKRLGLQLQIEKGMFDKKRMP